MENLNDSKTLAIRIAKILDKKKAQQLRVLKVQDLTVLTDYFVIASGTSTTQVASLADEVQFQLSQEGVEPYHTEGFDSKNWILLDYCRAPAPITTWSTCGPTPRRWTCPSGWRPMRPGPSNRPAVGKQTKVSKNGS